MIETSLPVTPIAPLSRRFSVAPMLDWTDRHDRYFLRQISQHALLYTEMVTSNALLHGPRERLLAFDPAEQPIALQLGGSDPVDMAECAKIAQDWGYNEVNINVGCPSDRVQNGAFGACLMATPQIVADCVAAMQQAVSIPVTVKHRIGIDDQDEGQALDDFVQQVKSAGCTSFIVHARKAWLKGLSPKENRDIPPLNYERVYQLKRDNPELEIIINGGITTLDEVDAHLQQVDGVMVGREAYHNPYLLAEVDQRVFAADVAGTLSRSDIMARMEPYIARHLSQGERLSRVTRHMLGLYRGCKNGKQWRRMMSEDTRPEDAGFEVLRAAQALVEE